MNINVDAEEIGRFDDIASRWWDPDGEMAPLHVINGPRLRYIEQRVNSMIEIWGTDGSLLPVVVPPTDTQPDAHLMNGPATDGGPSQDDVDALLAKLDQNIAPIALPQRRAEPAAAAPAAAAPAAAAPAAAPARRPAPAAPPPGATSSQSDIDALFN